MVVILLLSDLCGPLRRGAGRRVTFVSYVHVNPCFCEQVEGGDTETFATTKEEEWVSKKKTEVINTKQIETRVKRHVVLEDGKVVEDSGPQVTTNTTEDSETQEHHQTELRKLGDAEDAQKEGPAGALEGGAGVATLDVVDGDVSKWVAVANPDGLVREVKERKVVSREETEEIKETEDVQHLGDITDEDFLSAVQSGHGDLRKVLRTREAAGGTLVSTGPRVVRDTIKTNKVTDTEETRELSSVREDGKIVTETQRTTEHEELDDKELPEDAPEVNTHKESSQRYFKAREQEEVDYYADGEHIAHEMRFKAETAEGERKGDGLDDPDWDSLSARARRRANQRQVLRYRGGSPMERKDALTKRPLDFDQEEETRRVETSKWLENHFGSESRSSKDSVDDDDAGNPPKTSFFNVTIKSKEGTNATRSYEQERTYDNVDRSYERNYEAERSYEPERDGAGGGGGGGVSGGVGGGGYFKGVSEWSERKRYSPGQNREYRKPSPVPDYRSRTPTREQTPTPPQRKRISERRQRASQESRYDSGYRTPSRTEGRDEPLEEPPPDYSPPTPPPILHHEKKVHQKTRFAADAVPRETNVKEATPAVKQKTGNIIGQSIRKLVGKIRSASAERKARQRAKRSPSPPSYQAGHQIDRDIATTNGGAARGSSDHHHHHQQHQQQQQNGGGGSTMERPVQRYYLGEDPFAGSIYGRENKYDGVRPTRTSSRKPAIRTEYQEERSQSTLGRFSKSTPRLQSEPPPARASQTLPRHSNNNSNNNNRHEQPTRLEKSDRSSSTINVSIINTVNTRQNSAVPPAKPARTYRNLSRSQSFNVQGLAEKAGMYKSNPHLTGVGASRPKEPALLGLKSPGLISSLSRSQRELRDPEDGGHHHHHQQHQGQAGTARFARNGTSDHQHHVTASTENSKRIFMKDLKSRAPELFKTLHEHEDDGQATRSILKTSQGGSSRYDMYEPPTRLSRDVPPPPTNHYLRRGSNSSDNYSETYHTTSRSDDPHRPSVTNTVKSFSKKTLPSKDGRGLETIESSETRSVTKSHHFSQPPSITTTSNQRYYDNERYGSVSPVVIEVRNYPRK
ncbi:PREDICTED: serine/arginine repetitive matrix protein 1 [Nicrophorus vespilloides]|uniref:Serine/arginine repetitive matrix protein 1 n=1 Tax=Nicrophorus vespilloides TaxID=110193 RepID=A0ABM1M1G3_NICVS|nr:PREDICTED: serine/arginine repetitive matrix protein 1 [Nicrophorus vespilloides]